jgi:hypothetical protein
VIAAAPSAKAQEQAITLATILSEVLALLKPRSLSSGGFMAPGDMAIYFPKYQGIKCYAMLAGECWLVVEGVPHPVLLDAGDCSLLPHGMPFQLTTDLSL